MVSDIQRTLPRLPASFVWERDYGPLWTGSDCTAFWLAPGPDDVLTMDGIRAPLRDHLDGTAKQAEYTRRQLEYKYNAALAAALQAPVGWQNQLHNAQNMQNMRHSGSIFDYMLN